MDFETVYEGYRTRIESEIQRLFSHRGFSFDGLLESMHYSLTAGGKRLRPVLTLEFCRIAGGDVETALPAACAVELLHTYSLIHDDLPCMDDDDTRRGKPSNHKVFGECTAVLAGDALQAEAFGAILRSKLPKERRADCALRLADAAGVDGICGGQFMDMEAEGGAMDEERLFELCGRKTGSLLASACAIGVAAAGGTKRQTEYACRYGAALGLAFQARDDMLDVLGSEEELGKPTGSDESGEKLTIMTLFGEEKCREFVEKMTRTAKTAVSEGFEDTEFLRALADSLAVRMK